MVPIGARTPCRFTAWSDITGGDDCSLDRSKPGERGKLLEELKAVLWAYLDAKLAAAG